MNVRNRADPAGLIAAALPDTGWVALAPGTGWSGSLRYRVKHGIVYLSGAATCGAGGYSAIAYLPAGALNPFGYNGFARSNAATGITQIAITSGGMIASADVTSGRSINLESIPPLPND